MRRREKIIVGIAFMAVVYAAYVLLFAPSPQKSANTAMTRLENTKAFVREMTDHLGTKDLFVRDKHILVQAAKKWNRELFLRSIHPLTPTRDQGQILQGTEEDENMQPEAIPAMKDSRKTGEKP
jgi:hypothetical protein